MIDKGQLYQILTDLRRDELKAYIMYTSCANYLKGQGLECLGRNVYKLAQQELEHAEELAHRMQDLELWVPSYVQVSDISIDSIEYCLTFLTQQEDVTIEKYNAAASGLVGDITTFGLIDHITTEEWQHREYFDRALTAFRQGGYTALLNKSIVRFTESED